ncbi:MAG: T9SS type A sorting domain-containing protein, partial [Bacteroidota bacterium]
LVLSPEKDNTLYENAEGNTSNGKGDFLFIGRNNTASESIRRTIIQFDLSGISQDQMVESASLLFVINRTNDNILAPASLHLVSTEWGEGDSDAPGSESGGDTAAVNDVTWLFAKFDSVAWENTGGDFEETPTATDTLMNSSEVLQFSSEAMATQINDAIANGQGSISWIVIGDESRNQSARKLVSRENAEEADRPSLTLSFSPTTSIDEIALSKRVRIYPNPVSSSQVFIEAQLTGIQDVSIRVKNLIGKTVYSTALPKQSGEISAAIAVDKLPGGIYFVSISTAEDKFTRKLIVK